MKKVLFCFLLLPLILGADIGQVSFSTPLSMDQPFGLALDHDRLLIADRASGKLFIFSIPEKKITGSQPLPCDHPLGIAWDGKGIWISEKETRRLLHFLPQEQRVDNVLSSDLEADAAGLGWDGENLWASAGKNFMKLDPADGTELQTFSGPGEDTTGVFCDGKYLWLAERRKDHIVCATVEGDIFAVLPSPGPYPAGLCRQGDTLWVLDFEQKMLYALDIASNPQPYYAGQPKVHDIHFSHSLLNHGPSSTAQGKLYLCVGEEDAHQKILTLLSFDQPELRYLTDNWGQKFAYREGQIPAWQPLELGYTVRVETCDLNYFILPEWVQPLEKIPADVKSRYLVDGHKLKLNDPFIKQLLKTIVGDEKNPFWIAFKIHRYLHLNMEYQRTGGWNAAPTVLKRGNGSCSEFTFSFIALARAAGLPARYEAGLVVRGDDGSIDDVYHRWAQVYLPPFGWIAVDPSRGKPATAMDVAMSFGSLSERFFITTHSGGDSPYLGWTYNYNSTYEYAGKALVEAKSEAKWYPVKKE